MTSLATQLAKIKEYINLEDVQHIEKYDNFSFMVNDEKKKPYKPSKTGLAFHQCDDYVRLAIGPYGSGKSTICCAEIILRAMAMPPCLDGVRRSRWAIIRNTYGDLQDTTLKTWLEWFAGLGIIRKRMSPRINYVHEFEDGDGKIELELIFLAFDRADDLRKLKSLELSGAYLNELCELLSDALVHIKSRVTGRFPAKRDLAPENVSKVWFGIICDTNPPPTDHWLYELFEVEKPEQHTIFHQPPAMFKTDDGYEPNWDADNIDNLTAGMEYYRLMMLGQTEEYIKVYVMGEYGIVVQGQLVYTNYNDDIHSVESIDIVEGEPIFLGWDFGITCPACLLCQYVGNQLHVVKEFIGQYITVRDLYKQAVLPFLTKYCQGLAMDGVGDPANTYNGIEQLEELDVIVEKAMSNYIEPRVSAVRDFLGRLVEGKPAILISREGCPKLRQGFNGKYVFKRLRIIGVKDYKDVPDKEHPYSDIHDCLQYISMHFNGFTKEVEEEYTEWKDERGKSPVGGY